MDKATSLAHLAQETGRARHDYDAFIGRLAAAGCRHTGSLIGVARLAFPEMMVEIEATAVA